MVHTFLLRTLALLSVCLFSCVSLTLAQAPAWRFSPMPDSAVEIRNFVDPYLIPWAGGLDNPQVSAIDLDRDGNQDLIIYDRHSERLIPMLHVGVAGQARYQYAPAYDSLFPPVQGFALFRDFNGDGDADLFTYQPATGSPGHIVVYENLASLLPGIHFFRPYNNLLPLETDRGGLGTEPTIEIVDYDVPALDDLDGDGDLDILTFDLSATLVEYHKNLSMELYGHADSLVFLLEEGCWGHFSESPSGSTMFLDVFCKNGGREPSGNEHTRQHLGSTLATFDLNGDQAKEAFVGDVGADNMILLLNGGDSDHAYMDSQVVNFPLSRPVDLPTLPAAYHLDIDQDGVRDLLISPNEIGTSENTRNCWYYRNSGTDSIPNFTFRREDFLLQDMLDFGSRSYPLLVDYDRDGLQDLLVGTYGILDQGNNRVQLTLFKNFGSDSMPVWELITDDLASLRNSGRYQAHVAPALGDLDNDGDLDMLIGKIDGSLDFYRNTSSSPGSVFPNFQLFEEDYQGIDIGASAAPFMVDINGDNLVDLLVGGQDGQVAYYRNTGNAQVAAFTLETAQLGQINVSTHNSSDGYSKPSLHDHAGERYLVLGNEAGVLQRFHWAQGLAATDSFPIDTLATRAQMGRFLAPTLADVDGDSLLDMIAGNASGGLTIWGFFTADSLPADTTPVDTTPVDTGIVSLPQDLQPSVLIFPQPAQDRIWLELGVSPTAPVEVKLVDIRGRVLTAHSLTARRTAWDLSFIRPGLYLLHLTWPDGQTQTQKLLFAD